MKKLIFTIFATSLVFGTGCSQLGVKNEHDAETSEVQAPAEQSASIDKAAARHMVIPPPVTQPNRVQEEKRPLELSGKLKAEPRKFAAAEPLPSSPVAAGPDIQNMPPAALPYFNQESYTPNEENIFQNSLHDSLSTFSIDVDTASYANIRRFITSGSLPPVGAVRIEEMINYFNYTYKEPESTPFSVSAEVGTSPWHTDYKLVRIGLKAREIEAQHLPPSNLVFLIDVSGSMRSPNKLPLLKKSMKMLVDQLRPKDRVSIVVYAGSDRIVLQPTSGDMKKRIYDAIDSLASGGSTHGSRGILTAYSLAERSLMPGGNNRIVLASDGDFNVGVTSRGELQKLVEEKRDSGIYLTVLGFGMGNYHDDTMEILADKGNGNYGYIDSLLEAKKIMVQEMTGTMFALARDVKIQVEFNPATVGAYRLIGYENRILNDEDFTDDTKDAGEIGVGHRVTALYEIIPAGHEDVPHIDRLKYRSSSSPDTPSKDLLTIKLRYKPLTSNSSAEFEKSVGDTTLALSETSDDFRFAAAVAGYGMMLSRSSFLGDVSLNDIITLARSAKGPDPLGYRAECIRLMEMTELLL